MEDVIQLSRSDIQAVMKYVNGRGNAQTETSKLSKEVNNLSGVVQEQKGEKVMQSGKLFRQGKKGKC